MDDAGPRGITDVGHLGEASEEPVDERVRLVARARVHDEPRWLVDHDDVVVGVDDRDRDACICLDSVRLVRGELARAARRPLRRGP